MHHSNLSEYNNGYISITFTPRGGKANFICCFKDLTTTKAFNLDGTNQLYRGSVS